MTGPCYRTRPSSLAGGEIAIARETPPTVKERALILDGLVCYLGSDRGMALK
ncbi:MAG: hypothetical protein AB4372_05490 [Xenococcus sp. (in: cyanobacteria)]